MTDILAALSALGKNEQSAAAQIIETLRNRGCKPSADRIAWADLVVKRGVLAPQSSAVLSDQVGEAQRFIMQGGFSAAEIAGDEITQDVFIEIEGLIIQALKAL